MKQFVFIFYGRERGAIGICHDCRQVIVAETKEDAERALYDTHEHIQALECVREVEIP